MADFSSLSEDERALVREAQRRKKEARKLAKAVAKQCQQPQGAPQAPEQPRALPPARTVVSRDEYFDACPSGLFRDPNLPATADGLALLLRVLDAGDENASRLQRCNYFQFSGPESALWDPEFNARLAWEGFFTITASTGKRRKTEPLPELQPFYGVLTWPNFAASKHVRTTLARLRREQRGYRLAHNSDPLRTWQQIEGYHAVQHGSNWLTRQYFEMMRLADADPTINFRMHCIELYAADEDAEDAEDGLAGSGIVAGARVRIEGLVGRADLNGTEAVVLHYDEAKGRWAVHCADGKAGSGGEKEELVRVKPANLKALPEPAHPLAGEIGFSIGRVYTSLSGWTGERTASATGTAQLVLLGRWLQQRGYRFWSLGHCYSPEMDYKRQLGHRIYTREQFRALLRRHRGPFRLADADHELLSDGGARAGAAPQPHAASDNVPVEASQVAAVDTPPPPPPSTGIAASASTAVEEEVDETGVPTAFTPLRPGDVCDEAALLAG